MLPRFLGFDPLFVTRRSGRAHRAALTRCPQDPWGNVLEVGGAVTRQMLDKPDGSPPRASKLPCSRASSSLLHS